MVGHVVRDFYQHIWFRVHSLPDSKRYAESDEEWSILLERHNELAVNVLGISEEIYAYWYWPEKLAELEGSRIVRFEDDDLESCVYAQNIGTWKPGTHDELLKRIADDESSQVMFVNPELGNTYAPYDGGADLYIPNKRVYELLRKKYAKWKSNHASGM